MDIQIDNFDPTQLEAINACCNVENRVVSVTGSAGTGKTTIMRTVYNSLVAAGYTVALCAPTGKAAKRIKEATGIHAVTIHKLLEYSHPGERNPDTGEPYGESTPKRCRAFPLEFDVVLADEYAMVNKELHRNLFDALKPGGAIRCFGDVEQLPPIDKFAKKGEPSPFQVLLNNKKLPSIFLETIHRQAEGSGIISNGKRIKDGKIPQRLDDFALVITNYPTDKLRAIVKAAKENADIDFSSIDHQIITPTNKTWIGTLKLNSLLQAIFRPETDGWQEIPRHSWVKEKVYMREGDKVIFTQNNYDIRPEEERFEWDDANGQHVFIPPGMEHQVFNGETGIIVGMSDYGEITVDVGDRVVTVPPELPHRKKSGDTYVTVYFDPRKDLDLAYAITTHKAQGSEYQYVIYMLNKSCMFMQSRKNFYTGITRARKHVTIVSDQKSLSHSIWKKE